MTRFLWTTSVIILLGCGTKQGPNAETHTVVNEPSDASNEQVATPVAPSELSATLTGTLSEGGESRGKTIAAWNGVPVGETFYYFTADADQTLVPSAESEFMVRAPDQEAAAAVVGKRVIMTGTWSVPEPVEVPSEPTMMQVPVNIGPSGESGVVQPATIFVASGFKLAE